MEIAVRYYTKTGNTKKLAEAIASEVGVEAKPMSEPVSKGTDLLFLGSSVYAAGVDPEVKRFITSLDASKVKKVVAFSTAALLPSSYAQVKKLLEERGISVAKEEFHCRGQFKIMHRGRPNANDISEVKDFIRQVIQNH